MENVEYAMAEGFSPEEDKAIEYMMNRGNSFEELKGSLRDGTLVDAMERAYSADKKFMEENGFSPEQINGFGLNLGGYANVYNPADRDLFTDELKAENSIDECVDEAVTGDSFYQRIGRMANSKGGRVAATVLIGLGAAQFADSAYGNPGPIAGETSWYFWSPADFNQDYVVDIVDLMMFCEDGLQTVANQTYINHSGGPGTDMVRDYLPDGSVDPNSIVNQVDFAAFANEWLRDAESEFGVDFGKIKAQVQKLEVNPHDPIPEIGIIAKVCNVSDGLPLGDYWIDRATFNVGVNNGLWSYDQTSPPPHVDWDIDWESNYDLFTFSTNVPGDFIKPYPATNGYYDNKTFFIYTRDSNEADLTFDIDSLTVHGNGDINNFNSLKIPLPKSANPD
jgi:hypothetical protein